MSDFELTMDSLNLKTISKKSQKIKKIALNDKSLVNLMNSIKEIINSLRENDCDWKANDNLLLMNIVQNGLIFTKNLKKMKSEMKKKLILSLILNVLDQEVEKNEKLKELKEKIIDGIETVVEPALQLAIMTQNNEFKIPKKFFVNLLKICTTKAE
tara:strand:+ start:87 stop:554 length:468 start_codon:yes stop_codon:yes gene_type:complete